MPTFKNPLNILMKSDKESVYLMNYENMESR